MSFVLIAHIPASAFAGWRQANDVAWSQLWQLLESAYPCVEVSGLSWLGFHCGHRIKYFSQDNFEIVQSWFHLLPSYISFLFRVKWFILPFVPGKFESFGLATMLPVFPPPSYSKPFHDFKSSWLGMETFVVGYGGAVHWFVSLEITMAISEFLMTIVTIVVLLVGLIELLHSVKGYTLM